MANSTISNSLFQHLLQPIQPALATAVTTHRSDWRSRKFDTAQHLYLTLYAQLTHAPSANAVLEELNEPANLTQPSRSLRHMLGFENSDKAVLHQSSFSRANAHRPYQVWRDVFCKLYDHARTHLSPRQFQGLANLGGVRLVDGSLFDCLARMTWAVYRSNAPKVKGHLMLDLAGLPDQLVLTSGNGSERAVLAANLLAHCTYVFDRGYNSYELFAQFGAAKAHFVTRLLKNAVVKVLKSHPVPNEQLAFGIVADQTIRLGRVKNALKLRQVSYRDIAGREWHYLTSRFDLEARQVVWLYLRRWDIEMFFGWLKRHLPVRHWYSLNENGLLIQLFAALITFLLLKLYAHKSGRASFRRLTIDWVRWVRRHLWDEFDLSGPHALALVT